MYLIDDLEKVQKWATKILRQCTHLNYRQHLEFLNLPKLGLMRKHVSTTMTTYLAAVLQDASKTYVPFLLLCTIV